ncbi:unnamed protein product [Closterium sp. NIES-54]
MLRCASPLFPSLSPSPAPSPSLTISGQHGQHEGVPRGSSSTAHAERFPWHAHARAPFNSPPFLFPPTTSLSHHLQANMANRKASLGGHLQPMLKDFHHTHMRVLIPTYPFLFSQLLSLTLLVSPHYPLPAPPSGQHGQQKGVSRGPSAAHAEGLSPHAHARAHSHVSLSL